MSYHRVRSTGRTFLFLSRGWDHQEMSVYYLAKHYPNQRWFWRLAFSVLPTKNLNRKGLILHRDWSTHEFTLFYFCLLHNHTKLSRRQMSHTPLVNQGNLCPSNWQSQRQTHFSFRSFTKYRHCFLDQRSNTKQFKSFHSVRLDWLNKKL